jgi:hypothetical protein
MAQFTAGWLNKHIHYLGVVVHACNPIIQEVEARGSDGRGQPKTLSQTTTSKTKHIPKSTLFFSIKYTLLRISKCQAGCWWLVFNPSHSGGRDQEAHSSKPPQVNSS